MGSNASMQHERLEVTTTDGTKLRVEHWRPQGDVRFVMVVAHGGAEHVGRYARLAKDITAVGGWVVGPDHRGQGESGGTPGHVMAFEEYAADLRQVMLEHRKLDGAADVPWFLFGHSMGGLISLIYLLEHADDIKLRGAVLSSPLLRVAVKVPTIKLALGRVAQYIAPKFAQDAGIPPEHICRDPEEVKRYANDPRRSREITAGWFAAMNRAMARAHSEVGKVQLPLLWYVGTGDKIVDHTSSHEAFANLKDADANDQTLRTFDGYFHELHNEPDELRKPVIDMLTGWLTERLG